MHKFERSSLRTVGACFLIALSALAAAQRYNFIVTGDGRSKGLPGRPGYDENGVNKTIMQELVQQTLKHHAKFMMFSGDLVLGYTTEEAFKEQLLGWRKIMEPLYDAGVHIYLVRGNHDASSKNNEAVWESVFSGRYAMPQNGPEGETGATWSAKEKNALLIGLDDWGNHPNAVNQTWLDEQLAQNKQPLIFAMGHEMAFRAGMHKDNLDNDEYARDRFVESLAKAGAKVYLAGHDHLYDHLEATRPGVDIHQFVVGTAGAPFYDADDHGGANEGWKIKPLKHILGTYGYTLVEVNGLHVKMTFMGRTAPGKYKPMDVFSFTAAQRKG